MSGFLVNLVRRGAGLMPTVSSRPAPPAEDVESGPSEWEGTDGDVSPLAAPAQSERAGIPSAPPSMATPAAHDVPAAPLLSQPVAAAAASIVQRVALPATPGPLAPIPSPVQPSPPAAAGPREAGRIVVADASPPWRAPMTKTVASGELAIDVHAAPVDPAASADTVVDLRPLTPPFQEVRAIDRLITTTQLTERARDAVSAIADISPPSAPVAPPVERPSPAAHVTPVERAAPDALMMPERVVHVRIGAIEIHGAAPPVAALPAASSQPAPIAPASDIGFDRYARLRSYAPLNW